MKRCNDCTSRAVGLVVVAAIQKLSFYGIVYLRNWELSSKILFGYAAGSIVHVASGLRFVVLGNTSIDARKST